MITLWDDYCIDADEYQYILGKRLVRRSGDVRLEGATYHKTLAQALLAFYRMNCREVIMHEEQTLCGAIAAMKEIEERLAVLLEGFVACQDILQKPGA